MKKSVFLIVLFLFTCVFFAQAQEAEEAEDVVETAGGKTVEERATNQSTKIATQLNLNDDQKTKVKTAISNRITKMQEVKKSKLKGRERGQKMKEIAESFNAEMKATLSPEQVTQLGEMKGKGKGKGKNKKGN